MIKSAKVSLLAVKRFEQSVAATRDYSTQFDKGIACFEDLLRTISEQTEVTRDSIRNMESAQNRLKMKIKGIEAEIAKRTSELNDLEDQLSSLERELTNTYESFSMTNEDGEGYEIPNPEYAAIEFRIAELESEISVIDAQLAPLQQRLNRANTIDGQLSSQIDASNSVIYSLQEKKNSCMQYRTELEEVKNLNFRSGTSAVKSLKRIEEIIDTYIRTKMIYEAISLQEQNVSSQGSSGISININDTNVREIDTVEKSLQKKESLSEEDIRKHHIRFDDNGRIAEYDNKTFGGEYNTYETRLSRTSADDSPMLGYYVGERGESKYIPSGRTADGVVVIDILNQYGLDGIEYRNAEPDFEVCSEAVVKINSMSENRMDYYDSNGIPVLGNFSQADIECAKLWNNQKRDGRDDWNGRDVLGYRQANKLTWHEKCDTETMVLVRSEINLYFKHSGGCSECRIRDGVHDGGGFDE